MGRPFAIIGFTMFVTLFFLCFFGQTAALILLIAAGALLIFFCSLKKLRAQKVLLLALTAVIFSSALFLVNFALRVKPLMHFENCKIKLQGVVCDYPDFRSEHYYYEIKASSIGTQKLTVPTVIRLRADEDLALKPGDTLTVAAEMNKISETNTFSRLNYLSKGIVLTARCENVESVVEGSHKGASYLLAEYRHDLVESLRHLMPSDNAALSAAVLTGDKSYIKSPILEKIQQVGISHIICVSGLHLSVLAAALLYVFKRMRLPRTMRYLLAAACIFFFMALCGFSNSVVRAGVMFFVYICAELLLAEPDSENSLGIAAIVVLLNPFSAANIGFLFSFCATLSIIKLGAPCLAFCKEKWEIAQKPWLLRRLFTLLEIIVISICVNICCLPLSLLIYQKLSLMSLVANVLILPIASLLLISAGLTAVLGLLPLQFFAWLIYPFAFINSSLSAYTLKVVAFLNRSRVVSVAAGESVLLLVVALVLIACSVAGFFLKKKKSIRLFALTCILSVLFSICAATITARNHCNISVHSVGYGMCVSLQCGGKFYLIDCGEGNFAFSKISEAYASANAESISALFLTSDSRSESANALKTCRSFKVEKLICGNDNELVQLTPLSANEIIQRNEYVLEEASGLRIHFINQEKTAVMVEYKGVRVLILPNAKLTLAMLPKAFRSFEYLIIHGAVNNYVVNSALNGIIEVSQNEDAEHSRNFCDYAFYTTAEGRDIKLKITNKKTTIGRVNQWQR